MIIKKDILNDDIARIYLFVVDRIIKKIGGSAGKGGIKSTMSFYVSSMTGSPGVPRFVIHLLIAEELEKKPEELKAGEEDGKGADTSKAAEAGAADGKPAGEEEGGGESLKETPAPEKYTDADFKGLRKSYQHETREERDKSSG